MSPDERRLLSETYELAKENNQILRKMRRATRLATAFRIFYWVLIIGVSVGAYYVVQPYIDQVSQIYGGVRNQIDSIHTIASTTSKILK